jgi:hypothetical protein
MRNRDDRHVTGDFDNDPNARLTSVGVPIHFTM